MLAPAAWHEEDKARRRDTVSDNFLHDCTPSSKAPRWRYRRLKTTVIFWTHTLHDSNEYRDPRLAWGTNWRQARALVSWPWPAAQRVVASPGPSLGDFGRSERLNAH